MKTRASTPSTKKVLESKVAEKVDKWLLDNRIMFWRISISALARIRGAEITLIPNPMKGWSDRVAIWKGQFIALELKRPVGGEQRADQIIFEAKVKAGGGQYHLITNTIQLEGIFI